MKPKTPASLESVLRSVRLAEDAASMRAAVMELGYHQGDEAYRVLVEHLDHSNPSVQHAAVISLGRLGRAEAIDELIKPKIFRSPVGDVRWAAVSAVGRLGDYRVIDHLLKAAADPEWIVRTQAASELKAKVRDIISRKDVRHSRVLVHMLSLENEEIIDLAIDGFREIGLDSLSCLHEALRDSSATIRQNAARALGKLRSHQSTPYLLELLEDSDWRVRASAAETLGLIRDKISIEPLVLKIRDNVEKVQDQAANAIIGFGKQATIPLLNALAREKDKFCQRALLKCLGAIRDPKAAPALIDYLRSSYFIVRQAAVAALVKFGPSVIQLLLPTLSFNTSDIETLKADACDRVHPELQIRAIKALGGLEDHRAVEVLKELVTRSLPDVQEAASLALSQIGCAAWGRNSALKVLAEVGDASIVPEIARSLDDDSDNVRIEAVRAIGKLDGPNGAVKMLIRTTKKDPCDFIRAEALRMLRRIGIGQPGVLDAALSGLKDKSRDIRKQAARLLGNFTDKKSIPPLLKAMSDPHWIVRESAENALTNFGRDAVEPLIAALDSRSWTTRFRAARLLGELGAENALGPLRRISGKKGERKAVREVADAALGKIRKTSEAAAEGEGTGAPAQKTPATE